MAPKAKNITNYSNASPSEYLRAIVKPLVGLNYSLNDMVKAYMEASGKSFDENIMKGLYAVFGDTLFETLAQKYTEAHIEYKLIGMPEFGVTRQQTNFTFHLSGAIAKKSLDHSRLLLVCILITMYRYIVG